MQATNSPALPALPAPTSYSPRKTIPVEFIELELGLELLLETHPLFADAVKAAIAPGGGDFLFELPHGDRPEGKGRIAAIRFPFAGAEAPELAFAILSDDGLETRIEPAGNQPDHLRRFAESFIAVLERFGTH